MRAQTNLPVKCFVRVNGQILGSAVIFAASLLAKLSFPQVQKRLSKATGGLLMAQHRLFVSELCLALFTGKLTLVRRFDESIWAVCVSGTCLQFLVCAFSRKASGILLFWLDSFAGCVYWLSGCWFLPWPLSQLFLFQGVWEGLLILLALLNQGSR